MARGQPNGGLRDSRKPHAPAVAYGGKGTCRGVSARSGWRVNAGTSLADRFRAVPRTDTPRHVPDPPPNPPQASPQPDTLPSMTGTGTVEPGNSPAADGSYDVLGVDAPRLSDHLSARWNTPPTHPQSRPRHSRSPPRNPPPPNRNSPFIPGQLAQSPSKSTFPTVRACP
ncbi:hypothetical protein GCM10022232_61670 [Streptomyces plumbiresistens]|uniref:Uncharacterized protein n=1 Tax=Streptomyces plumbiresistens TaxID=511811 RepID=A0ABP7SHQ0_9ACTN